MTSPSPRDRRRWKRVAHDVPVIVVTTEGAINSYQPKDISAGGAFLYAEQSPEPGAPIRIDLTLRRSVAADGVVIRREPTGFAVQFRNMLDDDRHDLMAMIEASQ